MQHFWSIDVHRIADAAIGIILLPLVSMVAIVIAAELLWQLSAIHLEAYKLTAKVGSDFQRHVNCTSIRRNSIGAMSFLTVYQA